MRDRPIDIWRRKLEHLLIEEAKASDAAQLFTIREQVSDAKRRIADLESDYRALREQDATPNGVCVSIARLPAPSRHFVGRERELALLELAWRAPTTNMLCLVAFGGVGKTSLIARWLELIADDWRGAHRVYAYSFHGQGSREETQTSADSFLVNALAFFGDGSPDGGTAWDKGERLASLIRQQPTLLILDGVEPLQLPPSAGNPGQIRDPGLQALVRSLATFNNGLCVLTSRQRIEDVGWLEHSFAPVVELENLSTQSGAALLGKLGVRGTQPELEEAARAVACHGLALTLLGNYLRKACHGDVRRLAEVDFSKADRQQGGHAHRLMKKYEEWLDGEPALCLLRLMGLFDQPAPMRAVSFLCSPPISGLTDSLAGLAEEDWNFVVSTLCDCGLITSSKGEHFSQSFVAPNTMPELDAHLLVREYFAEQLTQHYPEATRQAHRRLYDFYRDVPGKFRPDTLDEMLPLYNAIRHGCAAGEHWDAFEHVYLERIRRGRNENYSWARLGAFGQDLAAMACFFERCWDQPARTLADDQRGIVLNLAGLLLRELGRLEESLRPTSESLTIGVAEQQWEEVAQRALNLSEIKLMLGDVAGAIQLAEQSVEMADRSGASEWRVITRGVLGDALNQSGYSQNALAAFHEAEQLQQAVYPDLPFLVSFHGYKYCDLLIGLIESEMLAESPVDCMSFQKNCKSVRDRAEHTLPVNQVRSLFHEALNHVTLGNVDSLEAAVTQAAFPNETSNVSVMLLRRSEQHLDCGVRMLRTAGTRIQLPRALLARACLWSVCASIAKWQADTTWAARVLEQWNADLLEVEVIAKQGAMALWQVDAALQRVRYHCVKNEGRPACDQLDRAKRIMKTCRLPYRPYDQQWEEWVPPNYRLVLSSGQELVGYDRRTRIIRQLESELAKVSSSRSEV